MKKSLLFAFMLLGDFLLYSVLQICAVFVAFFLYGSGATFSRNAELVGGAFLGLHLAILAFLFYKKLLIKTWLFFFILAFLVIGLFVYLNYLNSSFRGY